MSAISMFVRACFLSALLPACLAGCAPMQQADAGQPEFAAQLLEDVRILSADDMEGRRVGSAGSAKARDYLVRRLVEAGAGPAAGGAFEHTFQTQRRGETLTGVNLLARIEGTGASDHALLVMAHYDHLGVRDGVVFNGADDNASGVAAVLAIATSMKQAPPEHDVILALFDAEEGGLSGARALVADAALRALMERTVLAVNLDMLSRSDRNELYAAGAFHQPWLKPHLDEIARSAPVVLKQGHDDPALGKQHDWTMQSDHGPFHTAGKKWVYFGVEDHPDYHRATDDFAVLDRDFFVRATETAELAIRLFDRRLDSIALEPGPAVR